MSWIDCNGRFRLAIAPRPAGGERLRPTMQRLAAAGVEEVVSLLGHEQVVALGLEEEGAACAVAGIGFRWFPMVDHAVPADNEAVLALAGSLLEALEDGRWILVHCLAGIGRSGMVTAAVLLLAGFELDDALARISAARGLRCPETAAQLAWLHVLARELREA